MSFTGFQNDLLYSARYPLITGLPFKCSLTANPIISTGVCNAQSWPNGYIGPLPGPIAYLFNGNYKPFVVQDGAGFNPVVPPLYAATPTYPTDGYTIAFSVNMGQKIVLVAEWDSDGTLFNANILDGVSYTDLGFEGTVTYYTNDP